MHSQKCTGKHHLRNGGHFVQGVGVKSKLFAIIAEKWNVYILLYQFVTTAKNHKWLCTIMRFILHIQSLSVLFIVGYIIYFVCLDLISYPGAQVNRFQNINAQIFIARLQRLKRHAPHSSEMRFARGQFTSVGGEVLYYVVYCILNIVHCILYGIVSYHLIFCYIMPYCIISYYSYYSLYNATIITLTLRPLMM